MATASQITYRDFLQNVSETWELVEASTGRTAVSVQYRVLPPPAPGAELARLTVSDRVRRFWFSEWMADAQGLYFREVEIGDRRSPVTPPLRVTFDPKERNATERIFDASIEGMNAYYDGLVVEKEFMPVYDETTQPAWEWRIRIKALGNQTRQAGADVTMRLQAGMGIMEYFGQVFGVFFVLKRTWLLPLPGPGTPQPSPPPVPRPGVPRPGPGGGGSQVDTFGDHYDRIRKKRWDAKFYLDQLERENEWRKGQGQPPREATAHEKQEIEAFHRYTKELRDAGRLGH